MSPHKQYWPELKKLADKEDIVGFFKLYSEYLKACNIISPSRTILYEMLQKMTQKVINKLEE